MMKITGEKVLDWVVPILLTGALHGLSKMMRDVSDLSRRLEAIEQQNAQAAMERKFDVEVPLKRIRGRSGSR